MDYNDDVGSYWVGEFKNSMMNINEFQHILIVGMGKTGHSIAQYLSNKNINFSVYDKDQSIQRIRRTLNDARAINYFSGPLEEEYFLNIDCVAISPGIDLRSPKLKSIRKKGIPFINDLAIFSQEVDRKKIKIIGVTGTNGKTTVCTLLEHLFLKAGYKAKAAGNIGLPILSMNNINELDIIILELSSFQLEISNQLIFDVGMILNITEDHMDRYDSFNDYALSKRSILNQSKNKIINIDDEVIKNWNIQDAIVFSELIQNKKNAYGIKKENKKTYIVDDLNTKINISDINLIGKHNQLNVMAVIAVFKVFDHKFIDIEGVLKGFPAINNRLERVAEINGIIFYNDSKATNVASAMAAINSFEGKNIFLIAGGDSKSQDLTLLYDCVKSSVSGMYLIGKDALLLKNACRNIKKIEIKILGTMKEAVQLAFNDANSGDIILLAPACASYGMYKNYIERGDDFKSIVSSLV